VGDFARDEEGVTAIEFGILALPFFTVVAAILQTGIMFLVTQVLDSAVEDASRRVRTGQAVGYSLDNFRDYMCGYTFGLIDCSQIQLRSKIIDTFNYVSTADDVPYTCDETTCTWKANWQEFQGGAGRSIMQVSAYYRYPLFVVFPYFNLKNQPDNYRMLVATRVFRNEPFS
jgi:Flp pilus assembly protein TadG